jgi:hypothetical protein
MNPNERSLQLGMGAIAILLALAFVAGQQVAGRRVQEAPERLRRVVLASAVGAVAWLVFWFLVARSGALGRFDARPPPLGGLMGGSLLLALWLGLGPVGGTLARGLPLAVLVGIQGFRVPLEVIMHEAAGRGVMPVQMSWSGWNFDVLAGLGALGLGAWIATGKAPRAAVWAWVTLGWITLLTIIGIAIASTPLLHAFGSEPARLNTWIAQAPYVWLPSVMVVFAFAGQIVVIRKLRLELSPIRPRDSSTSWPPRGPRSRRQTSAPLRGRSPRARGAVAVRTRRRRSSPALSA